MPRPRIDAAGIGGSSAMGFKGSRVRIPPSRPLNLKDLAPREGRFSTWRHTAERAFAVPRGLGRRQKSSSRLLLTVAYRLARRSARLARTSSAS